MSRICRDELAERVRTGLLVLARQENAGSVWFISKMNLLLHGSPDSKIENDDTLVNPKHVRGGESDLFDRVLSNPRSR